MPRRWIQFPVRLVSKGTDARATARKSVSLSLWKETRLLRILAISLLVVWLLGMVTSVTLSGFIHLLLVMAVIVVVLNVIQGRRAII